MQMKPSQKVLLRFWAAYATIIVICKICGNMVLHEEETVIYIKEQEGYII